jgi:hypothetical protein
MVLVGSGLSEVDKVALRTGCCNRWVWRVLAMTDEGLVMFMKGVGHMGMGMGRGMGLWYPDGGGDGAHTGWGSQMLGGGG